jgi:hypothetical protein
MPPEYVGPTGAESLKQEAGGTLIFLNGATEYAISRLGVKQRR